MTKNKCKACGKNYKVLTKEGFCAYCFRNEHKFWSKDFSAGVDSKGNIAGIQPMKFRKTKVKNRKRKKRKK